MSETDAGLSALVHGAVWAMFCHRKSPFNSIASVSHSWFKEWPKFPMAVQPPYRDGG